MCAFLLIFPIDQVPQESGKVLLTFQLTEITSLSFFFLAIVIPRAFYSVDIPGKQFCLDLSLNTNNGFLALLTL